MATGREEMKKPAGWDITAGFRKAGLPEQSGDGLGAVVADGLDRAAFLGFLALAFFLGGFRLLVDEGIAAVVVALEVVGGGFAAEVAVDALVVDVELATGVFGVAICVVSHRSNPCGKRPRGE